MGITKIPLLLFLMKLITEVHIPAPKCHITYKDRLLLAGSCFADNLGARFLENKFNAVVNPFGVLYNPVSVLQMLQYATGKKTRNEQDLVHHGGLWHSMDHHGSFSREDKAKLLDELRVAGDEVQKALDNASFLFITWGTAWVYQYLPTGRIVANCHKIPANEFKRFRLTSEQIIELYSAWITEIAKEKPNIKIVLTISPVRHLKDSAHGNQLSKSVLLLSAEKLCRKFEQVMYFPSYEIVLDELRDYRFFAEDMTHPNQIAINYIWEKIKKHWLAPKAINVMKEVNAIVKAAKHKPLKVDTPEHQKFLHKTLNKISALNAVHPELNFSTEQEILTRQISTQ